MSETYVLRNLPVNIIIFECSRSKSIWKYVPKKDRLFFIKTEKKRKENRFMYAYHVIQQTLNWNTSVRISQWSKERRQTSAGY